MSQHVARWRQSRIRSKPWSRSPDTDSEAGTVRKQLRYQLVYRHELTRGNEVLKVPWPLTHDMSSGVFRLRALVNRGAQGPCKTPLHQL